MKTLLIRAALALGLLAAPAWADGLLSPGTISAVDSAVTSTPGQNAVAVLSGTPTANSAVSQAINGQSMALLSVRGTWAGSLAIEVSGDQGASWSSASGLQRGGSFSVNPITGNGQFRVIVVGQTNIRVRATVLGSGTPAVQINLAQGPGLVDLANAIRLFDNVTGNQAGIKPGNTFSPGDNAVGTADATTASAVKAASDVAHSDATSTSVPTGTKAAPAASGVSLLSVPLPWTPSTSLEACHVFKTSAGTLYRIKMTLGDGKSTQPNGFLKLYDLAAIPADGTDAPKVIDVVGSNGPTGAQSGSADDDANFTPMSFTNGLVACFSTSGGFTKTSQTTPATFFSAQVQ